MLLANLSSWMKTINTVTDRRWTDEFAFNVCIIHILIKNPISNKSICSLVANLSTRAPNKQSVQIDKHRSR